MTMSFSCPDCNGYDSNGKYCLTCGTSGMILIKNCGESINLSDYKEGGL